MNISALFGKTVETVTSADTYFDELPVSKDGNRNAFNSLKISAEEKNKIKTGTVVLEDNVQSPYKGESSESETKTSKETDTSDETEKKPKQVSVKLIL